MPTYQALSDLVTIQAVLVGTSPQSAGFAVPMIAAEFALAGWGSERARTYTGSRSQMLADLVADGFAVGGPVYRAAYYMMSGNPQPSSIVVGRRDAADADWATALSAIYAEDSTWYAFCLADERTAAGILDAATWAADKIVLFVAQTADSDVYAETAGNLAEDLHDLTSDVGPGRCALLWHDPETASDAAAPYVTFAPVGGATGTWDLRSTSGSMTLNMRVDGGTEEIATVAAAPATVTSSNTSTFALSTSGWSLGLAFDGAAALTTTFTFAAASVSSGAETFDLTAAVGGTVEIESDTGTDSYTIAGGSYADPALATAAEVVAEFDAGINVLFADGSASGGVATFSSITKGTNARFRFTENTSPAFLTALGLTTTEVAGSGNVATSAAVTIDEVLLAIRQAIGSAGTVEDPGTGALRIKSGVYGTAGSVTISGTAGLLTALGLTAATTAGTGDVPDASAVTPLQLEAIIDGDYSSDVSVTVDVTTGEITIESTTGVGYWHTLSFTGSLREPLGIERGTIRGAGVEDDHSDAQAIGARASIDIDAQGLVGWDFTPLRQAYGDVIPQNRSVSLRRSADVNTVEARSPTASYAALHDGRLCSRLDTGEPVFIDALIGIDWLGVRLQEAVIAVLERAAEAATSISYTDREARSALLTAISGPLQLAAQRGVIETADLTEPDAASGKVTGVKIYQKAELSSSLRTVRHWRIDVYQQGAGKLQGTLISLQVGNA